MSPRRLSTLFTLVLVMFATGAMAILNIATPAGAGLANDSVAYIAGARSILKGTGYSDIWLDSSLEAITHYPPLLSLSLAGIGLLGIDPLRGVRILNIFLFGANTLLMGILGLRSTSSRIAGLWLAALFLLNASILRVHVFALSEPLFLFLSLLSFLCLDNCIRIPVLQPNPKQKMIWIFACGLSTGLAFLTRYSALALLPTFGLAILIFHNSWADRLKINVLFLAGALPPMAIWFLRNKLIAGNVTNRTFQYHSISSANIQPGLYNTSQFLMPVEPWRQFLAKSGVLGPFILILGLGMLFWLVYRSWQIIYQIKPASDSQVITITNILYIFGYSCAVLFSMSFFDASTKLQPRILAPIYTACLLMFVIFISGMWNSGNQNKAKIINHMPVRKQTVIRVITLSLATVTLVLSTYGSFNLVAEFRTTGQGYASWKWHDSLIMAKLRAIPQETAIYTNTPPAVYLVTGRASRILPSRIDPVDNLVRMDYEHNMTQMRNDLINGHAVLALFDTTVIEDDTGTNNFDEFINGLKVLQKTQGDILYGKK